MHACKNLMVIWTAILVLGLAACGGGGGGGPSPAAREAAKQAEQKAEVEQAIDAAKDAVLKAGDSLTEADFEAADAAIGKAEEALGGADALSDSEKEELSDEISLLESNLAQARKSVEGARQEQRLRTAEEARKLTAAMSGARITGIEAELAYGEAPRMSGTMPGAPATAVAGLKTVAAGGASTESDWQGGRYTATGETSEDTVMLYTNIDPPGSRPFSGENGKYSADNGLDGDGNLPIVQDTDTTRIVSSGFPAGPGLRTHPPGAGGTVLVPGSFDGAPGTFVCAPAQGSACTSSIRDGGGYTLTGGEWKFVPEDGARVPEPDPEYQYFGWWLREAADGTYTLGAFHGGEGSEADEFADLAALQGPATYSGPAVGKFAIQRPDGEDEAGDFSATATLEVNFGDSTAPGTVEGEVSGFMVGGVEKDWSVELGSAAISTHGAIFPDQTHTALTRWTMAGTEAETTATWSGQFHDADLDRTPKVATGRFDAVHGTIGHMTGAFGTTR